MRKECVRKECVMKCDEVCVIRAYEIRVCVNKCMLECVMMCVIKSV